MQEENILTSPDSNKRFSAENLYLPAALNKNNYTDDTGIYVCEREITRNYYMHWHDVLEIELFISGEGTLQVNDCIYNISPGLINFVNYYDFHEILVKNPIRLYHLHFENTAVADNLLDRLLAASNQVCLLNEADTKQIIKLFELMIAGKEIGEEIRNQYLSGLLNSLIIYCFESCKRSEDTYLKDINLLSSEAAVLSKRGESRTNTILNAIRYVKMNFTEKITMSSVAKLFYTQEQYFCTKFHEVAGVTFTEYLRGLRLNHASNIVKHTLLPVKEIYSACGYQSKSHFMREFKKYFGVSPMQMRKEYRSRKPRNNQQEISSTKN